MGGRDLRGVVYVEEEVEEAVFLDGEAAGGFEGALLVFVELFALVHFLVEDEAHLAILLLPGAVAGFVVGHSGVARVVGAIVVVGVVVPVAVHCDELGGVEWVLCLRCQWRAMRRWVSWDDEVVKKKMLRSAAKAWERLRLSRLDRVSEGGRLRIWNPVTRGRMGENALRR